MEIKTCEHCNYSIDLSNEEFDILICPNCNSQLEEIE